MFSDPEGRGSPTWAEMMAKLAELDASLRSGPPFAVCGVQFPALEPRVLAQSQWSGGSRRQSAGGSVEHRDPPFNGLELVELFYGDGFASAGPAVSVRTRVSGSSSLEPDPQELLADERDRLFEHVGIDERVVEPSERSVAVLEIDGAPVEFQVLTEGSLWCARATIVHSSDVTMIVSVVGRAVPLTRVRLIWVLDLSPFIDARDEWMERISEAHATTRASADLSVPTGEPAVRALIDYLDADSERHRRRRTSGDPGEDQPRRPLGLRSALWDAAVDHQANSWDIDRTLANEQVTSLVNQLGWMAEHMEWFGDSAGLRDAAIDETIAYMTGGAHVASLPAQRAWARLWAAQVGGSQPSVGRDESAEAAELFLRANRERTDLRARWSGLWLGWAAAKSDP